MASCLHNFMLVDERLIEMVGFMSFCFQFSALTIIEICLNSFNVFTAIAS